MEYYVVFEGIGGENSNFPGIRTFTTFESKAAYEKWRSESQNRDLVVAEGVSFEEAQVLVAQTPAEARIGFMVQETLENPDAARLYAAKAMYGIHHDEMIRDN